MSIFSEYVCMYIHYYHIVVVLEVVKGLSVSIIYALFNNSYRDIIRISGY